MTTVWLRAHNVLMVAILTVLAVGAMAAARNVSFVAPRQPIPLIWPVATIQVAGLFLLLDTGFGAPLHAAVRGRLDRLLAVIALLALAGMLIPASSFLGAPDVLRTWLVAVVAMGMISAAAGTGEPWAVALVVGLLGIAAEFSTPIAPLSRLLAGPGPTVIAVTALVIGSAIYVKRTAVP